MRTPVMLAATALALLTTAAAPATATVTATGRQHLRINELQTMATHNSYHVELTDEEKDVQRRTDRNWWNLQYSHTALPNQFATQHVRGVELDVFPDPRGGLYTTPMVRRDAGLPPLTDPDLLKPGFKVLHWGDHDYGTNCSSLLKCLRQVKQWSDANPGHVPITILTELKRTDPAKEAQGGAKSPPWDAPLLDALDAEIRSVFPGERLITPDDVRRPGLTLEQSVLRYGWPELERSRGRVMFFMDNQGADLQTPYLAGRPNLEGRVLFTNARPGRPDAAFIGWNDPLGDNQPQIAEFVRQGYYVRTRSDVPFNEARTGDTTRLRAALASGAQMISTDFPIVGLSARNGSEYVGELPGGAVARCNPVLTPAGCRDGKLERLSPATRQP
ncbi:phosphatidylinositol-specific phospholipase C1-like protein [Nonomuraea sp. NBC_01738]|uniref:phosphatidylinositol-specific phospholipase C1-like protein n=1 Tax=Nonomuraea sp. NBC_01738 TaxID=2976003 RepID=UPI002E0E0350|nr:phosphatidylinositol-specific phospholipase C1-like protein [Nonomuraea sp. NBC_01738]